MKTKLNTKTIVAAVASVIGLAVYGYTSMVGYLAASATSTLPVVLTVAALVCLALRQFAGSKLPAVVNDVLLVAHAHVLRILTSQWLGVDPHFARLLRLDTAHYCVLSQYKGDNVIEHWNC